MQQRTWCLWRKVLVRCLSFEAESFQFVEFRGLTRWSEIEDALDAVGPGISATHLGAAFAQTQKLLPRPPTEFLSSLARRTVKQSHVLDLKSAIIVFYSCANLAYFNGDLLNEMAEVIKGQLYFMDFVTTAKMIHSLGKLQKAWSLYSDGSSPFSFPRLESLLQTLTSRLPFHLQSGWCDVKSVTLLVLGLAELKYRDRDVLQTVAKMVMHISRPSSEELTAILMALARLNLCDVDLVQSLAEEATRSERLRQFSDAELSTVIYALCRLGLRGRRLLHVLVTEASKPERLPNYTDHGLCNMIYAFCVADMLDGHFQAFLRQCLYNDRLMTFNARDLTTVLLALGRRPMYDEETLTAFAAEVGKEERVHQFTPADVSCVLFGFARCSFQKPLMLKPLIDSIHRTDTIRMLSPDQLANTVYAVGCFGSDVGDAVRSTVQDASLLKSFSVVSMVRLLTGLSLSSDHVPSLNEMCAREALTSGRLHLYSTKELTQIALAFGRMKLKTLSYIEPLESMILHGDRFRKAEAGHLADFTCSLADLRIRRSETLQTLVSYLMKKDVVRKIETKTVCRLLPVMAQLGLADGEDLENAIDALRDPARRRSLDKDVVRVVQALCDVEYDGDFWPLLLQSVNRSFRTGAAFSSNDRICLLQSFAKNIERLGKMLRTNSHLIETIVKDLKKKDVQEITQPQIHELSSDLVCMKYHDAHLAESLSRAWLVAAKGKELRDRCSINALSSLLELCFQMNVSSEEVCTEAESHLKKLHETTQTDAFFSIAPFLTHELLSSYTKLKTANGNLTEETLNRCLDLAIALQKQGVPIERWSTLASIYPCFLLGQRFHYRPKTNEQARILRQSMEAYTQNQSGWMTSDRQRRIQQATEALRELSSVHLKTNVQVREVNVDILSASRSSVVLFLEPSSGLDFYGRQEVGDTRLKRSILERHGYEVHSICSESYDEMSEEQKRQWLTSAIAKQTEQEGD